MSLRTTTILLALASAFGGAHATMTKTVSGNTTTYYENFSRGSSFSTAAVAGGGDGYLWVTSAAASSWSFSSAVALESVTIAFWYSVPDATAGLFKFGSEPTIHLKDTPGSAVEFSTNNPGPGTGGTLNSGDYDARFSVTYTDLAAGTYKLTFSSPQAQLFQLYGAKFDDIAVTTVAASSRASLAAVDDLSIAHWVPPAVPEPETWALMAAGLGAVGFMAKRRG